MYVGTRRRSRVVPFLPPSRPRGPRVSFLSPILIGVLPAAICMGREVGSGEWGVTETAHCCNITRAGVRPVRPLIILEISLTLI